MDHPPRILLVSFPAQGHINPALQFAKRLIAAGANVTFSTTDSADRRMDKSGAKFPNGLSFAAFSDGSETEFDPAGDMSRYISCLRHRGSESIGEIIAASEKSGQPFACVVYSNLIPWVAKVAREHHLPAVLLWNQAAAVLDIYYHYFNVCEDVIRSGINEPQFLVKLPGLPPLGRRDLPPFFRPENTHAFAIPINREHIENLNQESNPRILVNTFDELEHDALKSVGKLKLVGVGPLIPSAFLEGSDPSDNSIGGDLFQKSSGYIKWLNTKADASVIYISFGSISVMTHAQMEQMAHALKETRRSFLWVIREDQEEKLGSLEELKEQGMIVPWCSQVEVLSHSSIGCFVTHCGWNSTSESLASGVPVVGFPQWTDQLTNGKMVEDTWKTGVRVKEEEDGVVGWEEIKRCLELVMEGEGGKEMRKNAKKWRDLARKTWKVGGDSYNNLKAFVDEIATQTSSFVPRVVHPKF